MKDERGREYVLYESGHEIPFCPDCERFAAVDGITFPCISNGENEDACVALPGKGRRNYFKPKRGRQ